MKTVACVVLLVFGVVGVSARDRLQIAVTPLHSFAPSTLTVRVRVEPSTDNRALTIVAESEKFFRSSAIQLEGDASPSTFFLEFLRVPSGDYQVSAVLTSRDGHSAAHVRQAVTVISHVSEQ